MRDISKIASGLIVAVLLACCDAREVHEARAAHDSAGIEIVSLSPAPEGRRVVASEVPIVSVGGDPGGSNEIFTDVTAAVRFEAGAVAVADAGTGEIRLFSGSGEWIATAGREGEGPGEFGSLAFLERIAGDSLLAFDRRLQRVSIFTKDGAFVRAWSPDASEAPALLYAGGATSDGDLITIGFVGDEPEGEGTYLTAAEVGRLRTSGEEYDVVDTIYGSELAQFRRGGRMMPAVVPFGRKSDVAVSDEHIFLLDAAHPRSVHVRDVSGDLVRILRFETPRMEVEPGLTERWIESFFEQYRFAAPSVAEMWRRGFAEVTPPSEIPLFRSLETDGNGNVCAERYQLTETAPRLFWCLSPEGDFLREVELPSNLKRVTGMPQQDPRPEIGETQVLGILRGELDVERVELLPLSPGGSERR